MKINPKWKRIIFAAALALLAAIGSGGNVQAEDVSCTGSLGAITVDTLSVPQNATCTLNGTRVTGNIFVESNATLHASDIQVNGNLQAGGAARVNVTAGSSVNGNIDIRNSGAAEIRSVELNGNLLFENNDGAILAANNHISNNLQAFQNTGGVTINGNTISGNLQCRGNNPAPTGTGNHVNGNMEDQCADLGAEPPPPTNPPPVATQTPTRTPPAPTLTPTSTGTAPLVANEDRYTLTSSAIQVSAPGILANDAIAGPGIVEVVLVRPPQHGTATLGPAGDFTYLAQSGYFGNDSFDYRLRRAGTVSAPATVHLTMIDEQAPAVGWVAPVLAGERYDVRDGQQVLLEAQASDNHTVGKVEFLRWDAVNVQFVSLGTLGQPPYRLPIDASGLNPFWNQIFVIATDLAGNRSDTPFIWLYKLLDGPMNNRVFLPFTGR